MQIEAETVVVAVVIMSAMGALLWTALTCIRALSEKK